MNLLERYHQGQTTQVYEEILKMGETAFEKQNLAEVQNVLNETMTRVAYNLRVMLLALKEVNYCFTPNPKHDFQHPILKPNWSTRFRVRKNRKSS